MNYISDDKREFVGDFGNSYVRNTVMAVAEENNLSFTRSFLELGFTIDIPKVLTELNSVKWSTADEMNIAVADIVGALGKCKDSAFIEE